MKKLNLFLTLVALFFATTSLWAKPAAADANGKLPGTFTVDACGRKVYFSQANLQYTKSTGKWSFMDQQYTTVETNGMTIGTDYANQNVVSLFGWGTSGWNNDPTCVNYQPYKTAYSTNGPADNRFQYGPSGTNVVGTSNHATAENWFKQVGETRPYERYDWGVYNAITGVIRLACGVR